MLTKPAPTDTEVIEVIKNRWSTLAFDNETPLEKEKVMILLEAARWAPSSYNEQPWQYIIGYKGDETHQKLAECLMEGNSWARKVPVLMLSVSSLNFQRNDKPNRHALHDTGAASVSMALQAQALGLGFHQMAGFNLEKARELFHLDEKHEPGSMIAIGYRGEIDSLAEDLKQRELSERQRKSPEQMIWK